MPNQSKVNSYVEPFLTAYASPRILSDPTPGHYDPTLEMWVVGENGDEAPLISAHDLPLELATKTNSQRESDDQLAFSSIVELQTKTDTTREQDDTSTSFVLEMATKTEAQLEHDDTSPSISGMFI
ncbi:hypothetical protein [Pseudogemmobacter faecipullorum]|uniref:Uncharacterized protein n=1 Tax=Pseudogemmobacter faecipullorum TaxID=2755041 RepID=A0ABS8CPB4_9RHOB|nr:hypothetical protein [Pseudogemmobacter faecipullorum]MCB5411222.1 hypothetical protein [Pseudogemmobacter faecipullorum]